MKIKVYQIDFRCDRNNVKYRDYRSTIKVAGHIDPNIYKAVYDGEVEAHNLEEIYALLNNDYPKGYIGHSLSVSDVVELENGKCYFCDSIGFKQLKRFQNQRRRQKWINRI